MRLLARHFLVVAAIGFFSVIDAAEQPASVTLEGNVWQLESYSDITAGMKQVLPKGSIHAIFDEGKLHGSAGCNQYSGVYQSSPKNRLVVSDRIASTMMACAPAISQQERQYLALLPAVTHYRFKDDALQLLNAEHRVLLNFTARQTATLENIQWQAMAINNGRGGVVSARTTSLTSARFEEGKLAGNAGCNNYSASYTIADDSLAIGSIMTTRRLCAQPDGIMEQEQEFLQALQQARTFQLERDRLELRSEQGSLLVQFVKGK